MEKLLDEISFEGPDLADKHVTIDEAYVDEDARRDREERRSVPVHPVRRRGRRRSRRARARRRGSRARRSLRRSSLRRSPAVRRVRRCRRSCGCPVAPGRARPTGAGRRRGTRSSSFPAPTPTVRGPQTSTRVDIYAITGPGATITDADLLKHGTTVASVPVKAPRDPERRRASRRNPPKKSRRRRQRARSGRRRPCGTI